MPPITEELRTINELLDLAAAEAGSERAGEFNIIAAFMLEDRPRVKGFDSRGEAVVFFKARGINEMDAVLVDRRRQKNIIWMT